MAGDNGFLQNYQSSFCWKNSGCQLKTGFSNKTPGALLWKGGDPFIHKSNRLASGGSYKENEVQRGCFIGGLVLGVGWRGKGLCSVGSPV